MTINEIDIHSSLWLQYSNKSVPAHATSVTSRYVSEYYFGRKKNCFAKKKPSFTREIDNWLVIKTSSFIFYEFQIFQGQTFTRKIKWRWWIIRCPFLRETTASTSARIATKYTRGRNRCCDTCDICARVTSQSATISRPRCTIANYSKTPDPFAISAQTSSGTCVLSGRKLSSTICRRCCQANLYSFVYYRIDYSQ